MPRLKSPLSFMFPVLMLATAAIAPRRRSTKPWSERSPSLITELRVRHRIAQN
jgi:hypothetical protein